MKDNPFSRFKDNNSQQKQMSQLSIDRPHLKNVDSDGIVRSTPLTFKCKIVSGYLFSYHSSQVLTICLKSIFWLMTNVAICYVITSKNPLFILNFLIVSSLSLQIILYILVSFLDPGTIFVDEEETFDQDRCYCLVCKIYRLQASVHCLSCNRCVKQYDHHCGVFGKCIGKRNYLLFYMFLFSIAAGIVLSLIGAISSMIVH